MIDVNKEYRTGAGRRVVGLHIVTHNGAGKRVTYPVKGSVIIRENPRKYQYCTWTMDGVENIAFPNKMDDLVEVE